MDVENAMRVAQKKRGNAHLVESLKGKRDFHWKHWEAKIAPAKPVRGAKPEGPKGSGGASGASRAKLTPNSASARKAIAARRKRNATDA